MIRNKKGEDEEGLVGNSLGTVLGLTATLVVIAFIYLAITQVIRNNELEAAQNLANNLKTKIDAIETGQTANLTFQGSKNLEGWAILGWGKLNPSKPDKCFFSEGCICICKGNNAADCKEQGFCRGFDTEEIKIEYSSIIRYPDKHTAILQVNNYAYIPKNFFVVEISKTEETLHLKEHAQSYLEYYEKYTWRKNSDGEILGTPKR